MKKTTLLAITIGFFSISCCAMDRQQQLWADMDRHRNQMIAQRQRQQEEYFRQQRWAEYQTQQQAQQQPQTQQRERKLNKRFW